MSEPILPLPNDNVFVLQLQESHGRPGTCRAGRVKHFAPEEATRFATTLELWEFADNVLTAFIDLRDRTEGKGVFTCFI